MNRAAVALADKAGIESLSMRKLADGHEVLLSETLGKKFRYHRPRGSMRPRRASQD